MKKCFYLCFVLITKFNLISNKMKYKVVQKINPQKREEKKWYANAVNDRRMGQKEISTIIANRSSLTVGDIANTLQNLSEELPKALVEGTIVELGGLGSFRVSISSDGAENEKDFHSGMIKSAKIIFTPSTDMKRALENIKYEKE